MLACVPLNHFLNRFEYDLDVVIAGVRCGELIALAIIGGLVGRHWLCGFSIACLWACGLRLGRYADSSVEQSGLLSELCLVPPLIAVLAIAFLTLRFFRRWRLELKSAVTQQALLSQPIRITDFLVAMVLTASLFACIRAARELSEVSHRGNLNQLVWLIEAGVIGFFSFPMVPIVFGLHKIRNRIGGLVVFAIAVFIVTGFLFFIIC